MCGNVWCTCVCCVCVWYSVCACVSVKGEGVHVMYSVMCGVCPYVCIVYMCGVVCMSGMCSGVCTCGICVCMYVWCAWHMWCLCVQYGYGMWMYGYDCLGCVWYGYICDNRDVCV